MSTAEMAGKLDGVGRIAAKARSAAADTRPAKPAVVAAPAGDLVAEIFEDKRENFIAVTPQALIDRLSQPEMWSAGEAAKVRRLFMYMSNWRQQSYGAKLLELGRVYEPFSPDSDLLVTRKYSEAEKSSLEQQLMDGMRDLMKHANYTRIDPDNIELIMTKDSHYGLDLRVDLGAFDEIEIFYRGAITRKNSRRSRAKFYLKMEDFDVPIFQRLAIVFKLKSEAKRVEELMALEGLDRDKAERRVKKLRGPIADQVSSDFVYVKLFKNIPRSDIEMVFPNTKIRFRLFDKIKLGVTASGGLGMGVAATATKIAVATNPIALAGAVAGLGGVAIRQLVNFSNQRNKYMVTMAQNLYSHALADNRGAMTLLAERASEEDIKEEVLLYSLLVKERVREVELKAADQAIERYLTSTFGLDVNFDVQEALERLKHDGLVTVTADGTLVALGPEAAAARIDELWDGYLDQLVSFAEGEGREYEGEAPVTLT